MTEEFKDKFNISDSDKNFFTSILLLDNMIDRNVYYPVMGEYNYLDSAFAVLMSAERIRLEGDKYVPTEKGREFLEKFMMRYYEYVKIYDVYCGVDTETGEFALASYYDVNKGDDPDVESEIWTAHMAKEDFLDLRVAVAEFKKLNPIELVFMSFIQEDRFNVDEPGWEFDVYSGLFWDQIIDIVNGSLTAKQVDDAGHDLEAIIIAGTDVLLELHKIESDIAKENAEVEEEVYVCDECGCEEHECECEEEECITYVEYIEEPVYEYDYLEMYVDPFYVSPIWDPWYDPYYY